MKKRNLVLILVFIILVIGVGFMVFTSHTSVTETWNDTGTSNNHNDIWRTSNSVISREGNGTLITRGEDESWFYLYLNPNGTGSNYIFSTPFTLEFDIINNSYRSQIEFRDLDNVVSYFEFNSLPDRGFGHWKIEVNTTTQNYYHNDELVKTDNQTLVDDIRIGFVGLYEGNATDSSIKFANFKKY